MANKDCHVVDLLVT